MFIRVRKKYTKKRALQVKCTLYHSTSMVVNVSANLLSVSQCTQKALTIAFENVYSFRFTNLKPQFHTQKKKEKKLLKLQIEEIMDIIEWVIGPTQKFIYTLLSDHIHNGSCLNL